MNSSFVTIERSRSLEHQALLTRLSLDRNVLRLGFVTLLLPLVFFGCGDDSEVLVTNNLTASVLEVNTANPRVGFPLVLTTSIEALEATPDVSVSFYALNGDDVASELEQVRQFYLGTVTFPLVEPSIGEYQAEITVPAAVSTGDYVIMSSIDPADLIAELDEDDNLSETATSLAPLRDPNIYLESFVLDSSSIFLDSDQDDVEETLGDVQNSDIGGTLSLAVEGTQTPSEVEVFVKLRITRSDLPLGTDTHDVPLYLWDSENQRYVDIYGLTGPEEWLSLGFLEPQHAVETDTELDFAATENKSVHLDVYMPGGLAGVMIGILENLVQGPPPTVPPPDLTLEAIADLRAFFGGATAGVASYSLIAEIRSTDTQLSDEDLADNSASKTIFLILPGQESQSPDRPLAFESGLAAGWENDRFGVGFEFDAFAFVDGRGALAEVQGAVPTTIFGNGFDFMWFDARAQVVPAIDPAAIPPGENSSFSLELQFATSTIYSYEEDLGYLFDGVFSVSKEKSFEKQFFIGPVPVNASGGITGEIGYQLTANLQPTSLASQAGPFANLEATLEASVGVPGLQAGAGGQLTLMEERFLGTVLTGLDVLTSEGEASFEGRTTMRVSNIVSGPSGRLYLFAEYPGVKWCRRCAFGGCVSYPCGVKTVHKEHSLVTWQSFVKEDILFEESLCKGVVSDGDDVSFFACAP